VGSEQYKLALVSAVELVLMRRGNTKYNLVVARLGALYDCKIIDCYEHPEYLRTILAEVYKEEYHSIISEIKSYLGDIAEQELYDFFTKM
jgi:ketopantoate reductase